jgi:hypothetical protein
MSAEDIQRYLTGAWRLMAGRPDGMMLLDLSADGFWNSFAAILLALPPLGLTWIASAGDMVLGIEGASRAGIVARLAVADIGGWILPIVGLALVARPAGIADRFVAYVVATNWGSVLIVWLMVPAAIVRSIAPDAGEFAMLLSLVMFILSMALTWRLTTMAIGRGAAAGSAVFAGMFVASLLVLFFLQSLLGLSPAG